MNFPWVDTIGFIANFIALYFIYMKVDMLATHMVQMYTHVLKTQHDVLAAQRDTIDSTRQLAITMRNYLKEYR